MTSFVRCQHTYTANRIDHTEECSIVDGISCAVRIHIESCRLHIPCQQTASRGLINCVPDRAGVASKPVKDRSDGRPGAHGRHTVSEHFLRDPNTITPHASRTTERTPNEWTSWPPVQRTDRPPSTILLYKSPK